jgi:peptide/nickel transport system ATP-binding protein
LLRVEGLRVEARNAAGVWTPIVKGASFEVRRHEVVALIGESGSGKTTTCLAAFGYARAGCRIAGGRILLDGVDVLALGAAARRRLRGARVAYVAQSAAAAFNPALTILSQVTEASHIHRRKTPLDARSSALALCRQLELPEPERFGALYPHQVSGGQLQRLMAVMAVNCGPELLLLDEPTTALDVTTQIEVLKAFKQIVQGQGAAAIYVSHDLAVVAQIADRVIVLHDGELLENAATEEIINAPRHAYTRRLIAAVRPPPRAVTIPATTPLVPGLAPRNDSPPLLELRGISARYGGAEGKLVLRDVDIVLPEKTTVGVIGESGSGKSTLARVIAGLLPPAAGELFSDGKPLPREVRRRRPSELRRIQIVFQMADVALNPRHRVRDLLARPLDLFVGTRSTAAAARIDEMLDLVELPRSVGARYPHELSGGQKQRVNLARALIAEPAAILCDEVTSSLDTLVATAIIALLKALQARLGLAYLFISHDISTVASLAERIVVLYAGRIVEQGPFARVLAPPHHPYTRLLLSSVPELRRGWLEQTALPTARAMPPAGSDDRAGCPFQPRCPLAIRDVCDRVPPPVHRLPGDHRIVCHRPLADLA